MNKPGHISRLSLSKQSFTCSLLTAVIFVFITGVCTDATAAQFRVIELQHRVLEDILPALEPLANENTVVTGMNGQLILRGEPEVLDELQTVVRLLDRPARRVMIRVRHRGSDTQYATGAGIGADIRVGTGRGATRLGIQQYSTDSHNRSDSEFQVQGLDGRAAWIATGQSLPQVNRNVVLGPRGVVITDGVEYVDIRSGFYVLPRIQAEQVTISIHSQAAKADSNYSGAIRYSEAETVVTGALGQWLDLAGGISQGARHSQQIGATTRRSDDRYDQYQVQVITLD